MLNYDSNHKTGSFINFMKNPKLIKTISGVAVVASLFSGSLNMNATLANSTTNPNPTISPLENTISNQVVFENKYIESAIKEQSGFDILTKEVLENVKKLSITADDNIDEILKMPNLEELEISGGTNEKILNVITRFKKLKYLKLACLSFEIDDWNFLSKISTLEGIYVAETNISSLNLTNNPVLKNIGFYNCDLSEINLENITNDNVKSLEIDGCIGINNLSIINSYSNLTHLIMRNIDAESFRIILPRKLEFIRIDNVNIKSLEGIENLQELKKINIYDCNELTDAKALMSCPNLSSIGFYSNMLSDYYPWINSDIAELIKTKGKFLNKKVGIEETEKTKIISAIVDSCVALNIPENMEIISFKDKNLESMLKNSFGDLTKAKVNSIKIIDLSNIDEISLSELIKFKNLIDLRLININHVRDCYSLTNLDKLKNLSIFNCFVDDYSFFSEMKMIDGKLIIRGTNISSEDLSYLNDLQINTLRIMDANDLDFNKLTGLSNVKFLDLINVGLKDISFIKKFSTTKMLNISRNKVTDLSPLTSLPLLDSLDISNNRNLTSFDVLPQLKNLKQLISKNSQLWLTEETFSYVKNNIMGSDIEEEDLFVKKTITEIANHLVPDKSISEKEKIYRIVSYVLSNFKYDSDPSELMSRIENYNSNSLKYFLSGEGVCDNYASAVSALCTLTGVNSEYVEGYAIPPNKDLSSKYGYIKSIDETTRHAWNIVEIDNEYYYLDATWMDRNKNFLESATGIMFLGIDKYYLIGENLIEKDHYPLGLGVENINQDRGMSVKFLLQNREYIVPIPIFISILVGFGILKKVIRKNYSNKRELEDFETLGEIKH